MLLEGAQGTMLDIDFGTYPYVTSSNAVSGGATIGAGIPPKGIQRVLGVVKAYCSRVGGGPFATEQDNETGETLRSRGNEFGSTTGRPRRCGWLDGVALRHAIGVNGADALAVIGLNVLSAFEKVNLCVAYQWEGRKLESFPADPEVLGQAEAVYEQFDGWQTDLSATRTVDELPRAARAYLAALQDIAGAPIEMLTVGPHRRQIVRGAVDG